MTEVSFLFSRSGPTCLAQTDQAMGTVMPLRFCRPSRRSATPIVTPAKRGVDAAVVVHEAGSHHAHTSIQSLCIIGAP